MDLTVIRARACLVRARTALINAARGLTKSYGERLRGCSPRKMNRELAEELSPELQSALQPLLDEIESLSERIREYNERVQQIARENYPEVARLEQVKGVGTLIAHRFRKSRDVGCYLGLRPGRRNSGHSEPQLHISKEGDPYLSGYYRSATETAQGTRRKRHPILIRNPRWLFLAVVLDLFNRQVVGWSLGEDMRCELVIDALEMAWFRRHPGRKTGLIFHSDRGSQYASQPFQELLRGRGIQASMSRKGDCWDNACSETLFGSLKVERLHGLHFETFRQAKDEALDWLLWYNQTRLHSTLNYVSPVQYEQNWMQETAAIAKLTARAQ